LVCSSASAPQVRQLDRTYLSLSSNSAETQLQTEKIK
jgi:hypothetical protein